MAFPSLQRPHRTLRHWLFGHHLAIPADYFSGLSPGCRSPAVGRRSSGLHWAAIWAHHYRQALLESPHSCAGKSPRRLSPQESGPWCWSTRPATTAERPDIHDTILHQRLPVQLCRVHRPVREVDRRGWRAGRGKWQQRKQFEVEAARACSVVVVCCTICR